MTTNIDQAGQVPSIGIPQRGGGANERVIKAFRGILDNLTPEKFESLMGQLDELNINNEETLNTVVELIMEKALLEQSYSAIYAKMCLHLKELKVSAKSSKDFVYFQKLLLTKCRAEFKNHLLLTEKENDVSVAQEDLEQTRHRIYVRLLGTVGFIGELFKLKIIVAGIIHICVGKLLKDECEESLECLCKLLSIVGKELDTESERPKLDGYCDNISQLLKEKKPSRRINCMLQDVLALRKNNWVPQRNKGPKPIQHLHQEVKEAEERETLQLKKGITTVQSFINHRQSSQPEPAMPLEEQKINTGAQNKDGEKIRVEHKTKEEAPAQECDEEEVYQTLKSLLQKNSLNEKIEEWIKNTLNDRQTSSDSFVRAVTRAVCQSVIVDCGVYTLNTYELLHRVSLLKGFINDDCKQLVALNAVQQLVVHIDQPNGLLRMFCDVLLDEEVIQDETFFKWKLSSASEASLHHFYAWLREANRRFK